MQEAFTRDHLAFSPANNISVKTAISTGYWSSTCVLTVRAHQVRPLRWEDGHKGKNEATWKLKWRYRFFYIPQTILKGSNKTSCTVRGMCDKVFKDRKEQDVWIIKWTFRSFEKWLNILQEEDESPYRFRMTLTIRSLVHPGKLYLPWNQFQYS